MIDMNQINLQGWVSPFGAAPQKKKKKPWETTGATGAAPTAGATTGAATTAGAETNPWETPPEQPWNAPTGPNFWETFMRPKAAEYTDWPNRIDPALMGDISWLRDPSWNVNAKGYEDVGGAGVLWDPMFGYQLKDDLMGAMEKALKGRTADKALTMQEWQKLGSQYGLKGKGLHQADPWSGGLYSKFSGGSGGGGNGGGGGEGDYWTQLLNLLGGYDTLSGNAQYPKLPNEDNTQAWDAFLKYPTQWETASDVMSAFAKHGYPTKNPEAWKKAEDVATEMASSGLPVSQEPWYKNAYQVAQRDIMDAINQANEQAGLTGTRWSTPLGRTAQDIAGRRMETLGTENMKNVLGSLENARGRQMQATGQLSDIGSNIANLSEAAKARGLGAAGGLAGLGQQYVNYPMQLAQQAYGMGTAETAQQQAQIDKILAEYQRLMPENSPWLKFLQSSLGLGASSVGDFANMNSGGNMMSILMGLLSAFG